MGSRFGRFTWMRAVVIAAVATAAVAGCRDERSRKDPGARRTAPDHGEKAAGEVTTILSVDHRAKQSGVELRDAGAGTWREQRVGQGLAVGSTLRTASGVRTRVALERGAVLHLNEETEVALAAPRQLKVARGEVYVEVAPAVAAGKPLAIETAAARIAVTGTKLNVKAEADQTVVDVSRGQVEIAAGGSRIEVGAGERAVVRSGASPRVSVSSDLASITRWAREVAPPRPAVRALTQEGFGSLTARVPGQGKSHALSLASHQVRVTVQDNIARTEIEQRYHNRSSQTLEGTYRFPLPPGASISRLALYVGNRLEEGEIVERHRARAIFRQIVEDTIRPRDPALLEWVGGRIFQMKIFPIPPRSSRRVILAYTQPLQASHGRYQYVYPMSTSRGQATRVGRFAVEMKIAHGRGLAQVDAPLYPVLTERDSQGGAARLRYEATSFVPAASFVVNFAPAGEPPELQLALYEPPAVQRDGPCAVQTVKMSGSAPDTRRGGQASAPAWKPRPVQTCGDRGGFFMATLRPELPIWRRAERRDYLFLLDSSHSAGQRGWQTQRAVLEAFLAEMDLQARFKVMACDARCRVLGDAFVKPTAEARRSALSFARAITPGGSSDLQGAFDEAAAQARKGARVHVVYVGDGRPTAGELREPELARLVVEALGRAGATLSALAVGEDVAELFLGEATRRLGGAVHAIEPGDDVAARVFDVVAAQYRPALTDLEVSLEGTDAHSVYPRRLPTISAGSEVTLVGRYGRGGQGALQVRGRLDGKPFERRYPLQLQADAAEQQANSFIPRLWARHHLDALSVDNYAGNRPEIVRVSKAYTVLSRATAFLVLENERMYREFRVQRKRGRTYWKGDRVAVRSGRDTPAGSGDAKKGEASASSSGQARSDELSAFRGGSSRGAAGPALATATPAPAKSAAPTADDLAPSERTERPAAEPSGAADGEDSDADRGAAAAPGEGQRASVAREQAEAQPARSRSRAPASVAPPAPARRARMTSRRPMPDALSADGVLDGGGGGRSYRPRPSVSWVWVTRSRIEPLLSLPPNASLDRQVQRLRQQVAARPIDRGLRRRYHRALVRSNDQVEALRHAVEWAEVDASRDEALRALADVQAALAGTEPAMRTYSATVEVQPWSASLHRSLAEMYRNKGELRRSCAHRWSLVSLAPQNVERHLDLARCLAGAGERDRALEILSQLAATSNGRRASARIGRALAAIQAGSATGARPASKRHAVEVSATWNQPVDLDLVLVTPRGERLSALWPGRHGSVADSHDGQQAEVLGLRSASNGTYRVEVVHGPAGQPAHPVSGTVLIKAHGKSQVVPFVLSERSRPLARLVLARHRERRLHNYR